MSSKGNKRIAAPSGEKNSSKGEESKVKQSTVSGSGATTASGDDDYEKGKKQEEVIGRRSVEYSR